VKKLLGLCAPVIVLNNFLMILMNGNQTLDDVIIEKQKWFHTGVPPKDVSVCMYARDR
jgi:hypothetical protein